jgi:lysosomal alpha-mannosidase
MDDPKLLGYNLDKKVDDFISVSQEWATPYRTDNVLMTMGSDFQYMAAHADFKNMDKLIK